MTLEDKKLNQRFVSDFNLPIQVVQEPYFSDRVKLLEDEFSSLTNYNALLATIGERFGGNKSKFLEYYSSVRDKIITDTIASKPYEKINNCYMTDVCNMANINLHKGEKLKFDQKILSKKLYTQENDGGLFLSFDMKKANFQTLRRIDPEIVRNAETYEDFIGLFTDLDYIKNSKYTRQVIFGKMNPKLTIGVESVLSTNFLEHIIDYIDERYVPYVKCNDEIIFKFNGTEEEFEDEKTSYNNVFDGITYKIEKFKLHSRIFELATSESKLVVFEKEDLLNGRKRILKGVPATYFPQVYKLLHGMEISDSDLVFYYEHELCKFLNPLKLIK